MDSPKDTFRSLAATEIGFIRAQCAWIAAFSAGIADSNPRAAAHLQDQALVFDSECQAAQERFDKIAARLAVDAGS